MTNTSAITRFAVKLLSEDLIRLLYESILDRPPDDNGLRSYKLLLRQTGDLRLIAGNLSRSDEAWEKSLTSRPGDLAALILRGLLGREPDSLILEGVAQRLTSTSELESALKEFTSSEGFRSARGLAEAEKIPGAIYQIATGEAATPDLDFRPKNVDELRGAIGSALEQTFRSDHIYERIVKIHADKIVRAIGQGITAFEPDAMTLDAQTTELRASGDLGLIARNFFSSDEAWEKSLMSRPERLAASILRGLLGRDPDSLELEAIARPLTSTCELESALKQFTSSEGFRSARGLTEAGKIPGEIYEIATGEAATPDLDFSPKSVDELRGAIDAVLEQTLRSDRIYERIVKIHADKIVRAIGQGIMASEPDAKTLDAQTIELRASGHLRLIARNLFSSDEAWEKSLVSRPGRLAALLLRGLLGRDPDSLELETMARRLSGAHELEGALKEYLNSEGFRSARGLTEAGKIPGEIYRIATGEAAAPDLDFSPKNVDEMRGAIDAALEQALHSDRIYDRMVKIHAGKFVGAMWRGVAGTEPDAKTFDDRTTELRVTGDLANLIDAATLSRDRCRAETLPSVDAMIDCVYRGLLNRSADEDGLRTYRAIFENRPLLDALFAVTKSIGGSREAIEIQMRKGSGNFIGRPAWVFLHAEKTGGTSVQNMLRAAIGPDFIYSEHADNLHLYPSQALAAYDVFAGHFNFDSLRFIPRNIVNAVTILRDPHDRLVSLYTMWRAHTQEAQSYSENTEEAARLDVLEFFTEARCLSTRFLWNHMTWCVMGNWRWRQYQQLLAIDDPKTRESRIQEIKLEIISQIAHFSFIGILEHFSETCARLFKKMGLKYEGPRHDHTLRELIDRNGNQFRYVTQPKRTAELDLALSRLTELDQILYSEARARFETLQQC